MKKQILFLTLIAASIQVTKPEHLSAAAFLRIKQQRKNLNIVDAQGNDVTTIAPAVYAYMPTLNNILAQQQLEPQNKLYLAAEISGEYQGALAAMVVIISNIINKVNNKTINFFINHTPADIPGFVRNEVKAKITNLDVLRRFMYLSCAVGNRALANAAAGVWVKQGKTTVPTTTVSLLKPCKNIISQLIEKHKRIKGATEVTMFDLAIGNNLKVINSVLDLSNKNIKNLDWVPFMNEQVKRSIQILKLDNNQITQIPKGAFVTAGTTMRFARRMLSSSGYAEFPNLKTLSLQNNNIQVIENSAFWGLTHLINLNLQNNQISKLPDNVFQDLVSLNILNLNSNKLTAINSVVFKHVPQLKILNLNNNPFTKVPQDLIKNIPTLEQVSFAGNTIIKSLTGKWYVVDQANKKQ